MALTRRRRTNERAAQRSAERLGHTFGSWTHDDRYSWADCQACGFPITAFDDHYHLPRLDYGLVTCADCVAFAAADPLPPEIKEQLVWICLDEVLSFREMKALLAQLRAVAQAARAHGLVLAPDTLRHLLPQPPRPAPPPPAPPRDDKARAARAAHKRTAARAARARGHTLEPWWDSDVDSDVVSFAWCHTCQILVSAGDTYYHVWASRENISCAEEATLREAQRVEEAQHGATTRDGPH